MKVPPLTYKYQCEQIRVKMNYLKTYCKLIRFAERREKPGGYLEKHHTFPKSIYGNNKRIVLLTAREHYIAHALLEKGLIKRYGAKNWKSRKMIYAFWAMNNKKKTKKYYNSYLYEQSRKNTIKLLKEREYPPISEETKRKLSIANKGNQGFLGKKHSEEVKKRLSDVNKGKVYSEETIKKMSDAKKGMKLRLGKGHTEETKRKLKECNLGKKLPIDHIEKLRETNSKVWEIIDPNGNVFVIKNLTKFCKENNLDIGCMNNVSVGRNNRKQHKGYKVNQIKNNAV